MQPAPKPKPSPSPRENGGRPGRLGPALRIAISILIVWHFGLIFLAALSIPFSSPLVYALAQKPPMQWYLDALYLNQGHSFFAPEVGPGHVIYYELFDGVSPLTHLTMQQAEGLRAALADRGMPLPVYVGMRNWDPYLKDTLAQMSRGELRVVGG